MIYNYKIATPDIQPLTPFMVPCPTCQKMVDGATMVTVALPSVTLCTSCLGSVLRGHQEAWAIIHDLLLLVTQPVSEQQIDAACQRARTWLTSGGRR